MESSDQYSSQHRKIVDDYLERVIKPLLPSAWNAYSAFVGDETSISVVDSQLSQFNECFKGSPYYFNESPKHFIHYTTLPNLFNIIHEGAVRLYNFKHLDDPQEFDFSYHRLQLDYGNNASGMKDSLYCLSMSEYKENTDESYIHWERFGDHGKGAGIVFSFSEDNFDDWSSFHLSKIYYGEDHRVFSLLKEYRDRHNKFVLEQYFPKPLDILKLVAFHKNGIYKFEKEVRLLFLKDESSALNTALNLFDINRTVNRNFEQSSYLSLPLAYPKPIGRISDRYNSNPKLLDLMKRIPSIKIEKVILGYAIKGDARLNVIGSLQEAFSESLGLEMPIDLHEYSVLAKDLSPIK